MEKRMNRCCDNPNRVSLQFLRELDHSPPGTYIGSPKLNGFRRTADNCSGAWHYGAKHTTGDAAKPLPDELRTEFESLPWPAGLTLDSEWMGCREVAVTKGRHSLHIFDILFHEGQWLGGMGYERRLELLQGICKQVGVWYPDKTSLEYSSVFLVPTWSNPGLVDKFMEQLEDPLSEGLVVRHRHSGLIGSFKAPAANPQILKVKFDEVPSGLLQRRK